MAKSSRGSVSSGADVSAARLRSLCTAEERTLLDRSDTASLSKAAHAEVQALLKRARTFRDKWRGLVGKQTRVVKRAPKAVAEANARSLAKADLFDGAVRRFEAHLKSISSAVAGAARSAVKPIAALGKKPKHSRVASHRKARAGLRAELAGKVAMLNSVVAKPAGKPLVSKPVVSKPAAAVAVSKPAAAVAAPTVGKPASTAKTSSKKRKQPPAKAAAAAQAIRFDAAKQRSARTAAKNSRLKMEGLATRRASHTIAAGKRSQARRDKRR